MGRRGGTGAADSIASALKLTDVAELSCDFGVVTVAAVGAVQVDAVAKLAGVRGLTFVEVCRGDKTAIAR